MGLILCKAYICRCIDEVDEAVLDALVVGDGAGAKTLISIRDKKLWVPGEGVEDVFLEREEIWCCGTTSKQGFQLLTENVNAISNFRWYISWWWVPS